MKILFVTSSSINGGAQKHIREMFLSLSRMGNEVFLAAPQGWLFSELSDYKDRLFSFKSIYDGINVVSKLIDEIHPDITNTFILSGGVIGTAAWRKRKLGKIFVTVNNPVIYDGISWQGRLLYPLLYRWMGKYANAFLVKSDKVRDEVSNVLNGRRPVLSIKNGVDFKVFNKDTIYPDLKAELGICKESFIISNVAVLDERKGQKYLLEAAVRLREKYPIHFVISGEGPLRNTLEQEARQYKIDNIVHFLGRRSDVNCILANSQIFILPSNHEGLPNSLMEAMAMGVPCIATDVGGVRQLITGGVNGIIINPKSVDDIVESVTVLMNDKEKMKEMGDKAFQFIHDNFKQEEVVKELIQIYEDY